MRQAQRLLAKYNLDQATILREADGELRNSGAMAGGLVKVELRKARTSQPAKMDRTAEGLAVCCATNFEVKIYLVRSRRHTQIVFYGLRSGAQLAAYAFSVAFARVHVMQKAFCPPEGEYQRKLDSGLTACTPASYTATARRNPASAGMGEGLRRGGEPLLPQLRVWRDSVGAARDAALRYGTERPQELQSALRSDESTVRVCPRISFFGKGSLLRKCNICF